LRQNLGALAASMYEPLGISYTEALEMELADALIAHLDAIQVSNERAEQMRKEMR
jgi:hypothetical protein